MTAAVACISLAIWLSRPDPVEKAEQLLARAYQEQRQFEWRVPGAPWAQTDLKQDAARPKPASLHAANAVLQEQTPSAAVLALRGRAELLDFRVEAALTLLQQADRQAPSNVGLLTDLAVARALHGDRVNQPAEYSAAIDYATHALALDSAYAPALFNRALAFERLHVIDKAIADWEKLLAVEKDAGWSGEVRERLEALKKKGTAGPR